jgi:magnesium transporter
MLEHGNLFFFTPLIAAMAGNVGVQSSAIIVQGLANNTLSGSLFNRLIKEIALSLLNGAICLPFCLQAAILLGEPPIIGFVICCALLSVIIIASLIEHLCLCY